MSAREEHVRGPGRGFTLIEAMAAMAVMLIGAVGMAGLYTTGVRVHGDARRITRATAIARDLQENLRLLPYTDALLSNDGLTANDADVGDTALAFEQVDDPIASGHADHGEADLGAAWTGLPASALGGDYQRFWNVAEPDDQNHNGTADGKRLAVIVRWRQGAGWRRLVLWSVIPNPAER